MGKNTKVNKEVNVDGSLDKRKVAVYVRVSTDAQAEEGHSIQAQTEKLIALCVSKGWKDYELYVDPGYSGSNLERPEIQRLIKDIEDGKISAVVVYKLDRLSRRQKDTMYLIEDVFVPAGVDFVSLNESCDTTSSYGRAMIGMLSSFAQLERENIFMRTRMGMRERVKLGLWPGGGRVPYGYQYDKAQGILVPKDDEAENVRKMYDLYIQGYSPQKIANMFGLSYDKLVTQILERTCNIGMIAYNGEVYQGRHEPIISREIYDQTMQIMRERSESKARTTQDATHLLTGIIYCGDCGARLRYMNWGKGKFKLTCYSHMKDKPYMQHDPDCPYQPVWAEEVEQAIINDLFNLSLYIGNPDSGVVRVADPVEDLQCQISRTEAKLRRLYNQFGDDLDDTDDTLLETIRDTKRTLAQIKKEYETECKLHAKREKVSMVINKLSKISDVWPKLTPKEQQLFIREVVQKVVIHNADGNPKVEVFYTFNMKSGEEDTAAAS